MSRASQATTPQWSRTRSRSPRSSRRLSTPAPELSELPSADLRPMTEPPSISRPRCGGGQVRRCQGAHPGVEHGNNINAGQVEHYRPTDRRFLASAGGRQTWSPRVKSSRSLMLTAADDDLSAQAWIPPPATHPGQRQCARGWATSSTRHGIEPSEG